MSYRTELEREAPRTATLTLALLASLLLALPTVARELRPADPLGSLMIRGGPDASSLFDVASDYAKLTGRPLVVTEQHTELLEQARVGLLAGVEVPPDAVHEYAQALLLLGGFVVVDFDDTLEVMDYGTAVQENRAIDVDEAGLAVLDGHQAVFVRVTAEIPGVDPRQLSTSLRGFSGNRPGPSFRATRELGLEVTGPADAVLDAINWLRGPSDPTLAPGELDWDALFPPAARGIEVGPKDSLAAVLAEYTAATGRLFWVAEVARQQMDSTRSGLLTSATIPADRVHAFVEGLLASHGYFISVQRGAVPSLHAIVSGPRQFMPRPLMVDAKREDLARLREHAATIFGASLTLDRVDARHLSITFRGLLTGSPSSLMCTSDTNGLYVQEPGAQQAFLTEVILSIDGQAAVDTSVAAELVALALPRADMVLGSATPSMLELLVAYSQSTGRAVVVGDVEEQLLRDLPAPVNSPTVVPAGEVHAVVEAALAAHGALLGTIVVDPPLLGVGLPSGSLRVQPRMVSLEELEALAPQGSLFVNTFVPLEKLEPRQVVPSMRSWGTSFMPVSVMPVSLGEHRVLLSGTVANVRALASKLREYDAAGELPSVK